MHYYIVTGTSRGLGEAVVQALLQRGNYIVCISRNRNELLIRQAAERQVELEYICCDLSQVQEIEAVMRQLFSKFDRTSMGSIALINNAGVLAPIKPIELCTSEEIIRNVNVNLTAAMILSSVFISLVSELEIPKQIINVSSGAGKKPYHGWSVYCSTKAGIDMLTRCIALEQSSAAYPVRTVSFAPGVIDTEMQRLIRETPKSHFQDVERVYWVQRRRQAEVA